MVLCGSLFCAAISAQTLGTDAVQAQGAPAPGAARTVKIDEAVALALENNLSLESAGIDLRMKKRAKDYSWNVFVPSVQATGTLARSNRGETSISGLVNTGTGFEYVSIPYELSEKERWTAMAGLTVSLNLNLALVESMRAARQGYEAGQITWEQAKDQTEQNVRRAFYGILVQEQSLALAKEKLAASEERLAQTRTNFRNGLVPELVYLQTQLAVETQKPQIEEAELNLEQQKNFFAFLIGLPAGTRIALDGKIEPTISSFNADELVAKHLANRLDIALLAKNIALLETQERATRFQMYTPSLALSQSWSPVLPGAAYDLTDFSNWTDSGNWTDSSGAFSATLVFNLTNILPFTQAGQGRADISDSVLKLRLAMSQATYNAELEIRNLVKKLDKSRTAITAMELNVSIAEKAYRLTEQGYRAGTIEYLDLKDAETTLLQARLGVLAEKFTYQSTMLDLETALNAQLD
jgi:outer membrane protein TolC